MYAAAFTLDLYCENKMSHSDKESNKEWTRIEGRPSADGIHIWNEFPHQIVGWDRADAFREARKRGWRINKSTGTCYCPRCNGNKRRKLGD